MRGISFSVERGELFGLLGPNGAGKTTTIKMLITLLLPTAGEARVLGLDVVADARAVRRRIGYVFGGDRGLYERLSGLDNLRYFAELYGVSGRSQRRRLDEVLELVGLKGREQERVEGYSRGMRQRLHIARGILHDPEIVFLDEPTIGVDPVGARELRKMIGDLVSAGKTVLLTTHYMFEADALCDRIALIAKGTIVGEGTPAALKAAVADGRVTEIEVFGVEERRIERLRGPARRDRRRRRGARPEAGARRPDDRRARADGAAARTPRGSRGRARRAPASRRSRTPTSPSWAASERRSDSSASAGCCTSRCCRSRHSTASWRSSGRCSSRRSRSSCSGRGAGAGALGPVALGAAVMGVWTATSVSASSALQRERRLGTLELLVASPRRTWRSCCCR